MPRLDGNARQLHAGLAWLFLGLGLGIVGCSGDKTVNPTPSRDLMVTASSPLLASSTVVPGGNVDIPSFWTVKNQGTGTTADFTNGYYLSTDAVITSTDIYLGGNSNTGLAAGASYPWVGPTSVAIPIGISPGAYYFGILVDRGNAVAESNESNNYVSTPLTVVGLSPDLTITTGAPTLASSTVDPGFNVDMVSSWTVQNQGTVTSADFTSGYYLSTDPVITSSDTYLGGTTSTGLAPGDTQTWTGPISIPIPGNTPAGTYYLGILVDRGSAVAESDESNNYVSTAITVNAPRPDIRVQTGSPTATPTTVLPGGTVTLSSWTIENRGPVATGLFTNGFYLSTDPVITSADTYLDNNMNSLGAGSCSSGVARP